MSFFQKTKLTGIGSDIAFGLPEGESYALSSEMLETVLRYIALTQNGLSTEGIQHIRVLKRTHLSSSSSINGDELVRTELIGDPECKYNIISFFIGGSSELPSLTLSGYESMDKQSAPIAPFISQRTKNDTRIYVNKEEKRLITFARRCNSAWIEEVASLLFRCLPWIYPEGDKSLTTEDKSFFSSIHKRDWETFTAIANGICKDVDFYDAYVQKSLTGWLGNYRKSQIEALTKQVEKHRKDMLNKRRLLSDARRAFMDSNENLTAFLATSSKDDENELYKFFQSRKQLRLVDAFDLGSGSGKEMRFSILETLEYYDADEFWTCYNNSKSYFWDTCSNDEKRKLFVEIFGHEKGKLRVESSFILTNLTSLEPDDDKRRSGEYDDIAIDHPHLIGYCCLGDNEQYIDQNLEDGNWDLAIDQAIAATKNLWFGDSTVLTRMLERLTDDVMDKVRCVVTPDGKEMTPREFLKFVDEENSSDEAIEEQGE